jgi:hypothetical protein
MFYVFTGFLIGIEDVEGLLGGFYPGIVNFGTYD